MRRRAAAQADHLRDARAAGYEGPVDRLVPELAPRLMDAPRRRFVDGVHVARLGARVERTRWGLMRTLRGVEAIRGHCVSSTPLREVQVALDGKVVHVAALHGGSLDPAAPGDGPQRKYVFNLWLDLSAAAQGLCEVELRFLGAGPAIRVHREQVVVAAPMTEAAHPGSDAVVDPPPPGCPLTEAVNARPSMVRPAARAVFPVPPRNVLVLRTDQLGDMVASIPAMRRLRALLPGARIVGLLTAGNAEFAATLGLFDEAITVDFPDDPVERRRVMPLAEQEALRARLQPYAFDIALDLAESSMSRPLLLLSGARFLYGFHDRDWPWLDAGFDGAVHDPANRLESSPQSTRVLALVERLGSLLAPAAEVIRRPGLGRAALAAVGLPDGAPYAVLHTGARIAFSRWPGYPALARLLLDRTALHVVLMADDSAQREALPPDLRGDARFHLLDGRLPFDDFDALLSFCAAFVGNDSGPKHLAALRGVPVVSVHASRINWNEWGQELRGSVVSRRVPCAGCVIYHDPDECGQDFACIRHIRAGGGVRRRGRAAGAGACVSLAVPWSVAALGRSASPSATPAKVPPVTTRAPPSTVLATAAPGGLRRGRP